MSLFAFVGQCPHCHHQFTVRVDVETVKNSVEKVGCPDCFNLCLIQGEGINFALFAEVADAPSRNQNQDETAENFSAASSENNEPSDEEENQLDIGLRGFVSVIFFGIVFVASLPMFFSETYSIEKLFGSVVRAFTGGILKTGFALLIGAVVGVFTTVVISSITKFDQKKVANSLGVIALGFILGVYGYLNYFQLPGPDLAETRWSYSDITIEIQNDLSGLVFKDVHSGFMPPFRGTFNSISQVRNKYTEGPFANKPVYETKGLSRIDEWVVGIDVLRLFLMNEHCLIWFPVEDAGGAEEQWEEFDEKVYGDPLDQCFESVKFEN